MPAAFPIYPSVGAIVRDGGGRVVLHRRYAGAAWSPPSSRIGPGEMLTDVLHRQIAEQTGLSVAIDGLVGIYSDPAFQVVTFPDGHVEQFVTNLFRCRVVGGRFTGSDKGIAWDWFPQDDLPTDLAPYARIWLEDGLRVPLGPPRVR